MEQNQENLEFQVRTAHFGSNKLYHSAAGSPPQSFPVSIMQCSSLNINAPSAGSELITWSAEATLLRGCGTLLEEVCHWGRALSFTPFPVVLWLPHCRIKWAATPWHRGISTTVDCVAPWHLYHSRLRGTVASLLYRGISTLPQQTTWHRGISTTADCIIS